MDELMDTHEVVESCVSWKGRWAIASEYGKADHGKESQDDIDGY